MEIKIIRLSEFAMNILDTGQNNRLLPTAANSRYYRLVPF
ncbi:MAG: hypothetical protein JWR19_1985 [Pedosphaera sp.]|nr:hypothetical protein [Pedosphaera sp.]